jgi:hypothetical protein
MGISILVSLESSSLAHWRWMNFVKSSLVPHAPENRWMRDACIAVTLLHDRHAACCMRQATSDERQVPSGMKAAGVTCNFLVEVCRGEEQRGVLRIRLYQHFEIVVDDIPSEHEGIEGKARQGKARQGKARQGKARQGKARQGKARQGKARQGKARQGKAR